MPDTIKWTEEALQRVNRVPEGFMRKMTQKRVEEYALKNSIVNITLEVAEKVIETSRAGMGSQMGGDVSPEHMKGEMPPQTPRKTENLLQESAIYFHCFVCGFVVQNKIPATCPICTSSAEKFSKISSEFVSASSQKKLLWTENALKIIKSVPEDFRQDMTKWEIEGFARKNGYFVVSADVVEERYAVWENIAKSFNPQMDWDPEVMERVQNIPGTIRGMVMKEMELLAQKKEEKKVNLQILKEIKEKWTSSGEFHLKWMD